MKNVHDDKVLVGGGVGGQSITHREGLKYACSVVPEGPLSNPGPAGQDPCDLFGYLKLQLLRHAPQLTELTELAATLDARDDPERQTAPPPRGSKRLSPDQVTELVVQYRSGSSARALAACFQINRETVLAHLERAGVVRRANLRKLTNDQVQEAATHYATGRSLKTVALSFGVSEATLTAEFRRAGIPTRRRRGWPPSGGRS